MEATNEYFDKKIILFTIIKRFLETINLFPLILSFYSRLPHIQFPVGSQGKG